MSADGRRCITASANVTAVRSVHLPVGARTTFVISGRSRLLRVGADWGPIGAAEQVLLPLGDKMRGDPGAFLPNPMNRVGTMNTVAMSETAEKRSTLPCGKCFGGTGISNVLNFRASRHMTALAYSINWPECVTYALISVLLYLSDRPSVFKSTPCGTCHGFKSASVYRSALFRVDVQPTRRKWTPSIHSSHYLDRSEAKLFRVKLTNLNIPKIDLVEVVVDLLEAENLKSKNLADEYPAFVPADVAAVVHSAKHKPMRINELDRISRQEHRTWLIYAAWSCIV